MARRGWGGSPPKSDDEARRRIVEAAMRCIDRKGVMQTTLSDVAAELSVIRQTVYRYFPGTTELFVAVGRVANETFIDELTADLRWQTDPAEWAVEALASAVERLPQERYLTLLLAAGEPELFAHSMTSAPAIRLSRTLLDRSPIRWEDVGFGAGEIDELVELMVRLLQSMVIDPPIPPRQGVELRRFLRRWLAPAITAASVNA